MDSNQRNMAMLAHVLAIFTGFIGPLIMFLVITPEQDFARLHAKEALNFQLTLLIGYLVSTILVFVVIGILGLIALPILNIIFSIIAAMAANEGRDYRYPMTLRLIN